MFLKEEQKMLLLPQGEFKKDSIDNINRELIVASDVANATAMQLNSTLQHLLELQKESKFSLDPDLALQLADIVLSIGAVHRKIDEKIISSNPGITKVKVGSNAD